MAIGFWIIGGMHLFLFFVLGVSFTIFPFKKISPFVGLFRFAVALKSQETWDYSNRLTAKMLLVIGGVGCIFYTISAFFVEVLPTHFNQELAFAIVVAIFVFVPIVGLIWGMVTINKKAKALLKIIEQT